MAAIQKLSRNQSAMAIGSPTEVMSDDSSHQSNKVKVENINNATPIKPDELSKLIKAMTLEYVLHFSCYFLLMFFFFFLFFSLVIMKGFCVC
jgi:hypothetical protein